MFIQAATHASTKGGDSHNRNRNHKRSRSCRSRSRRSRSRRSRSRKRAEASRLIKAETPTRNKKKASRSTTSSAALEHLRVKELKHRDGIFSKLSLVSSPEKENASPNIKESRYANEIRATEQRLKDLGASPVRRLSLCGNRRLSGTTTTNSSSSSSLSTATNSMSSSVISFGFAKDKQQQHHHHYQHQQQARNRSMPPAVAASQEKSHRRLSFGASQKARAGPSGAQSKPRGRRTSRLQHRQSNNARKGSRSLSRARKSPPPPPSSSSMTHEHKLVAKRMKAVYKQLTPPQESNIRSNKRISGNDSLTSRLEQLYLAADGAGAPTTNNKISTMTTKATVATAAETKKTKVKAKPLRKATSWAEALVRNTQPTPTAKRKPVFSFRNRSGSPLPSHSSSSSSSSFSVPFMDRLPARIREEIAEAETEVKQAEGGKGPAATSASGDETEPQLLLTCVAQRGAASQEAGWLLDGGASSGGDASSLSITDTDRSGTDIDMSVHLVASSSAADESCVSERGRRVSSAQKLRHKELLKLRAQESFLLAERARESPDPIYQQQQQEEEQEQEQKKMAHLLSAKKPGKQMHSFIINRDKQQQHQVEVPDVHRSPWSAAPPRSPFEEDVYSSAQKLQAPPNTAQPAAGGNQGIDLQLLGEIFAATSGGNASPLATLTGACSDTPGSFATINSARSNNLNDEDAMWEKKNREEILLLATGDEDGADSSDADGSSAIDPLEARSVVASLDASFRALSVTSSPEENLDSSGVLDAIPEFRAANIKARERGKERRLLRDQVARQGPVGAEQGTVCNVLWCKPARRGPRGAERGDACQCVVS